MSGVEVLGRYVDVGGVRTYWESAGEGPAMLCLHTAGRDSRQWHDWIRHYAPHYRVFAPDLPGHHKSAPLSGNRLPTQSAELTEFLLEFCDAVNAPPDVVVGCSLGGNLVFELAQRRPDTVRALVSLEGADHGAPVAPFELLDHPAVRVPEWFLHRLDGLIGSAASPERRAALHWSGAQVVTEVILADLRMYAGFDVRESMHRVRADCLLLRGDEDWIVTEEMVRSTASRLSAARSVRVRTVPGAGHFAHCEVPELCLREVDAFLSAIGLPAGDG